MIRILRLGTVIALVLASFGVAPVLVAQGTGTLAGTVTDSASGRALEGARIALAGTDLVAITNAAGTYRIVALPAGDYPVFVTAASRLPVHRVVHVDSGATSTVDFRLASGGSTLLPGVVVTATRTPQPTRDVTATVNVLSREAVRTSPARTTDDLLREAPGVELPRTTSTASGAEEIVSIRGADEGRTLVLLDGVPLNDPWGEWIQWNRAPRAQIDHVEILEGGGSSLYGNYAMGGVISLFSAPITRRGYTVSASAGSRSATELSGYATSVAGPLGFSLGADYGSGGGYTTLRRGQRGPIDEASDVVRRNVNGRVEWTPRAGASLFADANYFSDDRALGTPLTQPNHRRIGGLTLGGSIATAGGTLEARVYGQQQRYASRSTVVNATRTAESPALDQSIPSHDVGGSVEWARQLGIFQTLAFGGDFRQMTGRLDETVYQSGGTRGARTSGGSQQVGGVFAQGVLAPGDPLRIELSARFDGWRSYSGSRVDATATPASATSYADKRNTAFAPRVGVRYAVLPTLSMRGSFYQAFRAPTLSEEYRTFYSGANVFVGNPELTPEHLTGYDVGVDWQPIQMLELRATTFWNRYRDLDDFTFAHPGPNPGGITLQRRNLGRATANGAEGEIALRPTDALTIAGTYNYDHAQVTATGAPVNRVPLQRATLRTTYADRDIAEGSVIVRHEGINHALGGFGMSPFTVFDLDARREVLRGAELFVSVENLFDRQYAANRAGPLEYLGLPRTVRGGLTLRSF